MSRAIDDLCPKDGFRSKVIELYARCAERKTFIFGLDTERTLAEQEANVKKGVSWTMDSDHLPQEDCCGHSHAIDFALVNRAGVGSDGIPRTLEFQWSSDDPRWEVLREEGEELGLRVGLEKRDGRRYDLGHVAKERL